MSNLATSRYTAVDALRGFIMMLMVLDHANGYVSRQHSSEFWAGAMTTYSRAFPFITRWVTHLCAPGFFFLMGAGIYWFAQTRKQAGWTDAQIFRRVAWRGLALFLVGQFLENPVLFIQAFLKPPLVSLSSTTSPPPVDGTPLYWGFVVMSGLGMVMMSCSLLLRWGPILWGLVAVGSVLATDLLLPSSGRPGPLWETILLAPGIRDHLLVMYPVIPWLGVTASGMCFGYWWRNNPETAPKHLPLLGAGVLLAGLLLRAAGGFGNIRLPRNGGWIEFLNTVKYPPSLVFWTIAVGINLLILAVLIQLPERVRRPSSPLIVFGQTPAFFFIAHLYLLSALALIAFRTAAPLPVAYLVWVFALILLYPVCRWYRSFKSSKPPESLWRLF